MYAGCKLRFPSQGGVPILTFTAPSPAVPTFQLKVVAEGESLRLITGLQLLGGARPAVAEAPAAAEAQAVPELSAVAAAAAAETPSLALTFEPSAPVTACSMI